jgi:hypothetical protein
VTEEERVRARERARQWVKENPERHAENARRYQQTEGYKAYQRQWREDNRERHREQQRAYYHGLDAEGKKRWNARTALNRAVRKGKVERGVCEVCAEPNAQGHHDDYDKPLDVRWLCPAHHAETHREVA